MITIVALQIVHQAKKCTVADVHEGCFVGDSIPGNPNPNPNCCQVDLDHVFLRTITRIIRFSSRHDLNVQNATPIGIRVRNFINNLGIDWQAIPGGDRLWDEHPANFWVPAGYESFFLSQHSVDLPFKLVDDVLKVMALRMPREGFYAILPWSHLERQPRWMRENVNLNFRSTFTQNTPIPPNIGTLAANHYIRLHGQWPGYRLVSMVIRTLSNREPMDEVDITFFFFFC